MKIRYFIKNLFKRSMQNKDAPTEEISDVLLVENKTQNNIDDQIYKIVGQCPVWEEKMDEEAWEELYAYIRADLVSQKQWLESQSSIVPSNTTSNKDKKSSKKTYSSTSNFTDSSQSAMIFNNIHTCSNISSSSSSCGD